jgi:hypothetical protein
MTIRASVVVAVQRGAAHFVAILFALLLMFVGAYIVVVNVKTLTPTLLISAGVCIALAMLLAIPAQAKDAIGFAVQVKDSVLGGRRWSDPPAPPQ